MIDFERTWRAQQNSHSVFDTHTLTCFLFSFHSDANAVREQLV